VYDSCVRFHEKKNYLARQIEVKPHPFRSSYVFIHEFALMSCRGLALASNPTSLIYVIWHTRAAWPRNGKHNSHSLSTILHSFSHPCSPTPGTYSLPSNL
jgi:hypothetical protein